MENGEEGKRMFFRFEEIKKMVNGKEMREHGIYFLKFRKGETEKWCHAMIDQIEKETITCRTSASAEPMKIPHGNILEFETNAPFDREVLGRLVAGNILDAKEVGEAGNVKA